MLERGAGSWDNEPYTQNYLGAPINQQQSFFPYYGLNNNVGLLTMPNAFYPAFTLDIGNFTGANYATFSDDIPLGDIQSAQFPFGYIPQVPIIPDTPSGLVDRFFEAKETLDEFFKKFYIALFALVLVAFGLYLLAKSTDTGKIAIGVAKKAVGA